MPLTFVLSAYVTIVTPNIVNMILHLGIIVIAVKYTLYKAAESILY